MVNLRRRMLFLVAFSVLVHFGKPLKADALSPAALLDKISHVANNAASIEFTANVQIGEGTSATTTNYIVTGVMEKPNLMLITVSQDSAATPDTKLPLEVVSDGKKYTVYSTGLKEYVSSVAQPAGYDSDDQDLNYFLSSIIGSAGRAFSDVSSTFFPADFNLQHISLPDGMTMKLATTTNTVTLDSQPYADIQQVLATAHGTKRFDVVYDPITFALKQLNEERINSDETTSPISKITFSKLNYNPSSQPSSMYVLNLPSSAVPYVAPGAPGSTAPNFSVLDSAGKTVKLSDYRGKIVVLDFWATWCPPCRRTLPETDRFAAQYKSKNVVVLPICTWDQKSAYEAWVKSHQSWTMKFLFDPAAQDDNSSIAVAKYSVSGIPTQYVIDKTGKVVYRGYADTGPGEQPLIDAVHKAIAD